MSYIGSTPENQSFTSGTDYFNGNGSTTVFTLSRTVVSVNDIDVVINNVPQQPNTAYTILGNQITFTSAPPAGSSNIYVRYLTTTNQTMSPGDNTVGTRQLSADLYTSVFNGFRNKIINGKMEIAQRGTSFTSITSGAYLLDRFFTSYTTTAGFTVAQSTSVIPSNGEFGSSMTLTVSSADTTIAAGDYCLLGQVIEGYNIRDLVGKTFTVSFWVRSSRTGVHCVALRNAAGAVDRSYIAEITINAANTYEYKTFTVVGGLPTGGTWNYTNSGGLVLVFTLASGSTYQTSAGAWQTGNFIATANQVNCLDTIGNIFAITGVQLEAGSIATPFEHRPIGTELLLCQRYFINGLTPNGVGLGANMIARAACPFPVEMRAAPSIQFQAGCQWYNGVTSLTISSSATNYSTVNTFQCDINIAGSGTTGYACMFANGTGDVYASAEL